MQKTASSVLQALWASSHTPPGLSRPIDLLLDQQVCIKLCVLHLVTFSTIPKTFPHSYAAPYPSMPFKEWLANFSMYQNCKGALQENLLEGVLLRTCSWRTGLYSFSGRSHACSYQGKLTHCSHFLQTPCAPSCQFTSPR